MKNRDAQFKTSSKCLPSPNICVAVKRTSKDVSVKDTKTGETLTFDHAEWNAFIAGVKEEEFDV